MDTNNFPWLELIDYPAFCVKDGVVIATNALAEQRQFRVGTDIREIVTDHWDIYQAFENGNLCLNVSVCGVPYPASVVRMQECDIFHLIRRTEDDDTLRSLSLAATQLRIPLANLMTVADQLLPGIKITNKDIKLQIGQINQNLYRLLRIVSNMSDACGYAYSGNFGMETTDIVSLMAEIMDKAQSFFADTGIQLAYQGPDHAVYSIADEEKIERAVYNLLSNAAKFSRKGSTVTASLVVKNDRLVFTLCNTNAEDLPKQNLWQQYRREPGLEDPRHGLGLGMTMASAAAASHGGTILADSPTEGQTRITMTIPIVKGSSDTLRSPIVHMGDYAGGRDRGLIELAEILPPESYRNIN